MGRVAACCLSFSLLCSAAAGGPYLAQPWAGRRRMDSEFRFSWARGLSAGVLGLEWGVSVTAFSEGFCGSCRRGVVRARARWWCCGMSIISRVRVLFVENGWLSLAS